MTSEENIAYINAMVACALIEAKGMEAENQHRMNCGNSIAYGMEAFEGLIEKYGIHHNAVVGSIQEIANR